MSWKGKMKIFGEKIFGMFGTIRTDIAMFMSRKQIKKLRFIEKCHIVISKRLTFEQALIELAEFVEVVEVNGQQKIIIENKFGKFMGIWVDEGKTLYYKEFKTTRYIGN